MDDRLAGVITFSYGDIVNHTYAVQIDGTVEVAEKEKRNDLLSRFPLSPDYTTDTFSYEMDEETAIEVFDTLALETGPGSYKTSKAHEQRYETVKAEVHPDFLPDGYNPDFNYLVFDSFTVELCPEVASQIGEVVCRRPEVTGVDPKDDAYRILRIRDNLMEDPVELRQMTELFLTPPEQQAENVLLARSKG